MSKSKVANKTKTAQVGAKADNKAFKPGEMLFGKQNYIFTIISFAVIILGFALMSGGEGDIYDFRRTTLAPMVVLLGFAISGYAILKRPKTEE